MVVSHGSAGMGWGGGGGFAHSDSISARRDGAGRCLGVVEWPSHTIGFCSSSALVLIEERKISRGRAIGWLVKNMEPPWPSWSEECRAGHRSPPAPAVLVFIRVGAVFPPAGASSGRYDIVETVTRYCCSFREAVRCPKHLSGSAVWLAVRSRGKS